MPHLCSAPLGLGGSPADSAAIHRDAPQQPFSPAGRQFTPESSPPPYMPQPRAVLPKQTVSCFCRCNLARMLPHLACGMQAESAMQWQYLWEPVAQQHQQRLKGWPADISMQPSQVAQHYACLRQACHVLAPSCLAFHKIQHTACDKGHISVPQLLCMLQSRQPHMTRGCSLASNSADAMEGRHSHSGDGQALQGGHARSCRHGPAGCWPLAGAAPACLRWPA